MTTAHEKMHLPGRLRSQLLQDRPAFVESVGKEDIATLADVMTAPDGKGTVLRLIMGATTTMPLRALTYADSALRIARLIPHEQLQIVHANHLGAAVNGVDQSDVRATALQLHEQLQRHIDRRFGDRVGRVLHASDTPFDLAPFAPLAEQVFTRGGKFVAELVRKQPKHKGDPIRYTSAHFAFQDTSELELAAFSISAPDQIAAERIVSIGCGQERNFYLARMAMRGMADGSGLTPLMVDSAQIFTRHQTPPYFVAHGGEPALTEATLETLDVDTVRDPSARRELAHFVELTELEEEE